MTRIRVTPPRLAWAGAVALAGGLAVYAWLRPWMPGWSGWLPSALHALAFVLWLGAALQPQGARLVALAAGWALLSVAIEALQHPALHALLPGLLARHWQGTFSVADVVATAAGAGLAAVAVARCEHGREPPRKDRQ